ncbi:hypothetical protein ACS0TY_028644 [Phlomoides rotata]
MPSELSNLCRLEEFYAGVNSLKGSIPFSIFNISTLRMLDLSFNQFDGTLPPNMGISLFNVERLHMNGNTLSGPIPSSITNASKLTHLGMDHNSFRGSIPDFGDLRLLRVLRLRGNNFTAAESTTQELGFLSSLTSCRYLEVLDVSDNPLHGILPAASIGNLSTSLLQFRAGGCIINGVIPTEIGNLTSLLGLYLYENQLQGAIPHHLCQMTNLAELDLSANMLMGSIPECFGEIKSLRNMNLGSNKLNSTLPSNFWDLSKLLILNLSSNYLSGNLSTQIGNMKAIYKMDLSSNQFSGDIPSSLDSCQSLETLSFSNNMLTGSIPQCLGSVRGLSTFDLSWNNLSGLIPKSLEKIPFLEHFNVSYNSLDGEIPNEGPFVNFTAQSFVNNSALCGSSRFQVPPCIKKHARLKDGALLVAYIVASFFSTMIWVIIVFMLARITLHSGDDHDRIPDHELPLGAAWRIISHRELVQGTNGFSETNLLGRGGCGSVYKGTLSDGLDIAVKVFNLESEEAGKSFDTECAILSSVRHRNIVGIIGCCTNQHFKALVLTYMPNGSLEEWLYCQDVVQRLNIATDVTYMPNGSLEEWLYCQDVQQRLNIASDVALALEYLHHHHTFPVVHRDIKPSNVLFDKDMTAHLADFGIGKLLGKGEAEVQTATLQATFGYAAPGDVYVSIFGCGAFLPTFLKLQIRDS